MATNQPSTKRDVGGQPDKSKDKRKDEKGGAAKSQAKAAAGGAKPSKGSRGKT